MLEIRLTKDGSQTVYNSDLDTTYHSSWGAVQESTTVFIENGLKAFSAAPQPVNILEIGFGTGLNAGLSWMESAKNQEIDIRYTGLEPYRLKEEIWSKLDFVGIGLTEFRKLHSIKNRERKQLGQRFSASIYESHFQEEMFSEKFDLIYYDAFDPGTQPELWDDKMMRKCADLLRPGGIWISYCSKGDVRRSLQNAGLEARKLKGPPGKRHILKATKPL